MQRCRNSVCSCGIPTALGVDAAELFPVFENVRLPLYRGLKKDVTIGLQFNSHHIVPTPISFTINFHYVVAFVFG